MNAFEKITLLVSGLSLLVSVLALLFLYFQVRFTLRGILADHERRRKQATIESLIRIKENYQPAREKIYTHFNEGLTIPIATLDEKTRSLINEYFSALEHFAVGVNTGIYDLDITNRMSGTYLSKLHYKFEEFLKHEQSSDPSKYQDFLELSGKIAALRKKQQECPMKHS